MNEMLIKSIEMLNKLKLSLEPESTIYRVEIIISILSKIVESEENWSSICLYLYPKYKNHFIEILNRINSINPLKIEDNDHEYIIEELYSICAYFLHEYVLYLSSHNSYEYRIGIDKMNLTHKKILKDDYPFLDHRNKERLNNLKDKQLDIWILGYYLYSKSFKSFERYAELVDESKNNSEYIQNEISRKKKDLNNFISEKENTVKKLANILEEQKIAFNFVGLSQGFESLLKKKKNGQYIVLSLLFFIGIFLFIPLFTYIEFYQVRSQNNELFDWKIFLPFVSIELITLYLFRVVLIHYNSIKTQIMQLELRQTLCQFIQSYAGYAKEIKEKDSSSLEKFENLIFSSILSDSEKVPSTFDGLEQLTNLIKNLKSGGN